MWGMFIIKRTAILMRKVWGIKRGDEKSSIEEEQTTQWLTERVKMTNTNRQNITQNNKGWET